jgi:hypothetical protein
MWPAAISSCALMGLGIGDRLIVWVSSGDEKLAVALGRYAAASAGCSSRPACGFRWIDMRLHPGDRAPLFGPPAMRSLVGGL